MKKQKKSEVSDEFDDFENAEEYESSVAKNEDLNNIQEEKEDPDQRRLRLAKELIQKTRENLQEQTESDNEDYFIPLENEYTNEDNRVNRFMQQKVLERKRKIQKVYKQKILDFYKENNRELPTKNLKGHKKPITICCFDPNTNDLYTAGKDGAILKFISSKQFERTLFQDEYPKNNNGHNQPIFSMDISFDGKFLITGDKSGIVKVWELSNQNLYHQFKAHSKSVNCLKFRFNSYEFCSASSDAQLKIWDAYQKGMIEQHFGHRSQMFDISTLTDNQLVSIGYDRRPIVWKVDQEKQMIFQERDYSLDCVSAINQYYFVTGSENGEISIWNISKKRPRITIEDQHQDGWITCLESIYNGDILVSGATDGFINFYEMNCQSLTQEKFQLIFQIKCNGVINDMKFSQNNEYLAVVVSPENKLGRWVVKDKVRSHIKIIRILKQQLNFVRFALFLFQFFQNFTQRFLKGNNLIEAHKNINENKQIQNSLFHFFWIHQFLYQQ